MEWRIGVSLFLCSYLAYSALAENTTTAATGPCRAADAACDAQGIVGNITRPTGNLTNDGKSASVAAESGRARAMNFTSAFRDNTHNNEMETVARMHSKEHSIDDVSMDDMDDDNSLNFANFTFNTQTASGGGVGGEKGGGGNGNESVNSKKSVAPMTKSANSGACTDRDGKVYKLGEKFTKGCDETCQCQKDGLVCSQQCKLPYTVKGRNKDPNCDEEPVEGSTCCVRLTCSAASDLEADPLEDCIYKNVSYKRGSTIKDDCESICICEASGHINCKARCAPIQNVTDNCVALPDKKDPCCTIVLCDVEEHDVNKIGTTDDAAITSSSVDNQILAAVAVNETTVALTLAEKIKGCSVDVSPNGVHWENALCKDNKISGLQPGKKYYFRLKNTASNKVEVTLPSLNPNAATATSCTHKGKTYKIGEEFHDGCTAFCICEKGGVECALIECPTDFGLDVLDPHCLEWDKSPPGFVPSPPHCCPDKVYCRNNGSCKYNDEIFHNWTELPASVTGCDKICYCEMGNVSCQPSCPTVSETPPKNLPCAPEQAVLAHPPGDDCCTDWTCPNVARTDEIRMRLLEAVDETTVRLVFSVPTFLVGLHGRVELRYTSDQQNNEPSTWEQQILAPPNDLIATKELEFELGGLQPNTTYKIKISVMMHDIDNAPSSSILTIKTLAPTSPPTTLPPILPVEPDMRVVEVNATYAKVAWRMFSDFELQFIDGVQLRYKELDDKIYAATPLIHRHVTTYTLEELKPDSTYEVKIFFVPFAGQTTELQAHQTIQIKTTVENDPYKFEVIMEVHHVKTTSIEISWSGVPYPEDKYVHIFRAIYQSDGNREDVSSFKAAKRDSSQSILIQDLKPGTRYRVWLEVYLTNGRTKKSNVKDFVTKHGLATTPSTSQGKLEGMAIVETNTYYGPLVAVSVLASIAIVTSVVLLLILAKKHGTNKAPITTPINRKTNSSAAYDNPSYKTYENDKNGNSMKNGSIALTVFPKTHIEKET